ncbi:MAG TPA: aminoacetone oxidase family FAD-binding enzyme, partial [Spirochaetota bacterium]
SLYNFSNTDLIDYFERKNVTLTEINDGKIFPASLRAQDILNPLLDDCAAHNVEIKYSEPAQSVVYSGGQFTVETGKGNYHSANLMIVTGGKSYPSTGSTGEGHRFARDLGHSVTETGPALTSVIIRNYGMSDCAGIAIREGTVHLFRNGKKVREQSGDILFTHKGLSGPAILNMSRYIRADDFIKIQMTETRQPDELEKILIDAAAESGGRSVRNIITSHAIPDRVAAAVMNAAKLPVDFPLSRLDKRKRRFIAECVTGMPLEVEKLGDYNEAMATRGGVDLREVNPRSMESRLVPGLFFGGEVLDVDGDTGGFNLQFAFSSGRAAADHMTKLNPQK